MWCSNAVNRTRRSRRATSCTRCRAIDALVRLCVRDAAAFSVFPSVGMIGVIFPVRLLHSLLSAGFERRAKRPTNPIPASLVSLVAGVFRSPNVFRGRSWSGQSSGGGVFLRISSSQGGRCGSAVRWRVFTCRRYTEGRSGSRITHIHRGLIGHRP